jgi:hypothetical protein
MVEFSKQFTWEIVLQRMTGNVVASEVDALTYVILSKAEKHISCGELFGNTECVMLHMRCYRN